MINNKNKSEGEYLKSLYQWSGLTIEKFCVPFNRTRQWANKAFKYEIIPMKEKMAVCRAYNIPVEYFNGGHELPMRNTVNDPAAEYISTSELEKENNVLRKKLLDRDQLVIELQQEVIRLMKELQLSFSGKSK